MQYTINDPSLAYLYRNALAYVSPSLYEGFCLPVIEAFSFGCPAIVSRNSALIEIGSDAAVYFDPEDEFDQTSDLAEPYRDDNENGQRDFWEPWWDFDADGEHDDLPNGIYNGSLCSDEAEAQELCTRDLVYVQDGYLILVLSGSFADITFTPTVVNLSGPGDSQVVNILIADVNGNPMPYDSQVKLSVSNGEILGDDTFKVPSTIYPTTLNIVIVPSENDGTTGYLEVRVTTPNGNISSGFIQVNDSN